MKKITLFFITIFISLFVGMVALNIMYPPSKNTASSVNVQVGNQNQQQNGNQATSEVLSVSNIANHSSQNDCYLIIKGNVYDVSTYISLHPGGRSSITTRCGGEVTNIFASIHSNFAWDLLGKYQIGTVTKTESNAVAKNPTISSNPVRNLNDIESKVISAYPNAEIINIKPAVKSSYIAKIILNGNLYEIHLDKNGNITKEELAQDEYDWNNWSTDDDD